MPTINAPGLGQSTLTPMCLPYSPEYRPPAISEGARALERLASATGGVERLNLANVWKDIPRQPRFISTAPYLLLAVVLLFLLEVIERRTGLFSSFRFHPRLLRLLPIWASRSRRSRPAAAGSPAARKPTVQPASFPAGKLSEPSPANAAKPETPAQMPKKEAKEPTTDTSMLDALAHAQERTRKRTERK